MTETETKPRKPTYNKTQLMVEQEFERHMFHRDRFAHYLRWSYVLRKMEVRPGTVLDVGCGDANLLKTLYVNRRSPERYWGADVRKRLIEKLNEDWSNLSIADRVVFGCLDVVQDPLPKLPDREWDYVVCFEVVEHVGKQNAPKLLSNIESVMGPGTVGMISTPVYDDRVGAAGNHVIQGEVGELTYHEMANLVMDRFTVVNRFGTFCSKRDVQLVASEHDLDLARRLERYYDPNVISVLLAPLYPEASRNVLWEVVKK